ncbi:MAG TPA: GTPase HflX [Polyangiaceae bacterium]|jgi:GTP-binding protein HflX|nr:GTPase HflX [Polyangiaceae bacterium]
MTTERSADAPSAADRSLPAAVIVGVKLPGMDLQEFESGLEELERLVTTLGYRPIGRVSQLREQLSPVAVLGDGKLKELAELTGGSGRTGRAPRKLAKARERFRGEDDDEEEDDDGPEPADADEGEAKVALVAVDHELSPTQLRNLERAAGTQVLDRAGVIIEIFSRRARTREARLQVEMARLSYLAPRVRESPSGKERQAGRGAGEAAIELDRRRIRDRLAELREQLAAVQREQDVRREKRRSLQRVALVGYTNAGKSSLMRALTGSAVEVEDRLFATLDTTVRALKPEVKPRVLVSDTVGFIKKLPHDLVASFKSTLDEALEASLLLLVVDASDPNWEAELEVTREVLREIGSEGTPSHVVMNKVDRLDAATRETLEGLVPDAWFVSALDPADVANVHGSIVKFFEAGFVTAELLIPYKKQGILSEMYDSGRVEKESYEEDGVHVSYRASVGTIGHFREKLST